MSVNHLKLARGPQSPEVRRLQWKLAFAKRMLCRNQNRRTMQGFPV